MPKILKTAPSSQVIELDSSSDDAADDDNDDNDDGADEDLGATSDSTYFPPAHVQKKTPMFAAKKTGSIQKLDDFPKKIINRRKSLHHSIRDTEYPSFESGSSSSPSHSSSKRHESVDDLLQKKQRWNSTDIDDAVDKNIDDPEIEKVLKKIAYCRVFTNYLLQQYNMLAIDFKLYSNLDLLNLDLKRRMEMYMAIQKSRKRFKKAVESGGGQIEL